MKLLWICPFFPYPPDNGTRIREHHLIREFSHHNQISIFSLIQSKDELRFVENMERYCEKVWAVQPDGQLPGEFDSRRSISDVVLGMFHYHPKHFYGTPSKNVVTLLAEVINNNSYDAIIVETLFMSNYIWEIMRSFPKQFFILSQNNVETLVQYQHFQVANNPISRLRKWIYYKSFCEFERQACELFDKVTVVSETDRKHLMALFPGLQREKVDLLPNGVDVTWNGTDHSENKESYLIYNGAMTYDANLDAVQYFTTQIFPLILKDYPEISLKVTGKTTGVDLNSIPLRDKIDFTGYVDDIRPVVRRASICVVSLRMGSGTRLKVLEALALGTPVVSTSKGIEGLDLIPGQDVLVADQPDEFAHAVVLLLSDRELYDRLRVNGRKTVNQKYSWDHIANDFEERLNKWLTVEG
jgi:glycosyltransferase involved in cell wall biosynthesis